MGLEGKSNTMAGGLKCVSFNMHGYNQGRETLIHLCTDVKAEIIFVQEHWLTPPNMGLLNNISVDYTSFGISAMDKEVNSTILKGRPYGGVAILVKNDLISNCQLAFCSERIVSIRIGKSLFTNVYFPYCSKSDCKELTLELLGDLQFIFNTYCGFDYIVGGDFNCNLDCSNWSSNAIHEFMSDYELTNCIDIYPGSIDYTYHHEGLSQFSLIDYFLISKSIEYKTKEISVIDFAVNLSDHLPVCIEFVSFDVTSTTVGKAKFALSANTAKINDYYFDWNNADIVGYYELTRLGLQPLFDDLLQWPDLNAINNLCLNPGVREVLCDKINGLYENIVNVLYNASALSVPRIKHDARKFWWDAELNDLKQHSIISHTAWIQAGKPRSGPIFDNWKSDKYKYKNAIRNKRTDERTFVSNDLHDALMSKNPSGFWKTWNHKFASKNTVPVIVDGNSDCAGIANQFATYFSGLSKCDPLNANNHKLDFESEFSNYVGDGINADNLVTVDIIDEIVTSLSRGKAPGIDSLLPEHIQCAHPLVISVITRLFNYMLICGVVPVAFGKGITIPIPKSANSHSCMKSEEFRGITISVIISKMFELAVLHNFHEYLSSSDAQLGFKKKLGCNHAIFAVKQVIDYYTKNCSTVNVCTLDISKAFDKVNYFVLMQKLMKRNMPKTLVALLLMWYSNSFNCVKWYNHISFAYRLECGVRQGGVLSPYLFAIYVNDILVNLHNSRLGCFIKHVCVNSFMYADDLILLSISLVELQFMVDICVVELDSIDLKLNISKCNCLRFGKRFSDKCCDITVLDTHLKWVAETRYLGVYFKSGKQICFNLDKGKQKFFYSINSIISKVGNDPSLVLPLCNSFCIPVLLYGVEVMNLPNYQKKRLDHPLNMLFFKLFKSGDNLVLSQCKYFMNCLPVHFRIDVRTFKFHSELANCNNYIMHMFFKEFSVKILSDLCTNYNLQNLVNIHVFKKACWNAFERQCEL